MEMALASECRGLRYAKSAATAFRTRDTAFLVLSPRSARGSQGGTQVDQAAEADSPGGKPRAANLDAGKRTMHGSFVSIQALACYPCFEDAMSDEIDGCALPAAARAEIDATFARLRELTHYDLLDLTRFASKQEVEAAFEIKAMRFGQGLCADVKCGPWHERIDAIRTRLAHAHDVLGNPIRRVGYDALLGPPPGAVAAASTDETGSVPVGIEEPRVVTERGLLGSLFPPGETLDVPIPGPFAQVRTPSRPPRRGPPAQRPIEGAAPSPPAPEQPILRHPARASKRPMVSRSRPPVHPGDSPVQKKRTEGATPTAHRPTGVDVMEALLRRARDRHHGPVVRRDAPPAVPTANPSDAATLVRPTPTAAAASPYAGSAPTGDPSTPTFADSMRAAIATAVEHEKAHRWDDAAASWEAASRAMPNEPGLKLRGSNALAHGAQASLRTGTSLRKALEQARAAVATASGNVNAHTTLAQVFLVAGLKTSARIALETACHLDPQSQIARGLLRKIKDA